MIPASARDPATAEPPAVVGGRPLVVVDSITQITPACAGALVVSGSHGGRSSAGFALEVPLGLACFNDAGVGKDRAGIVALDLLDRAGMPAVTVAHASARIGDALDAWHHGTISFVNAAAGARGLRPGDLLRVGIERAFGQAPAAGADAPAA